MNLSNEPAQGSITHKGANSTRRFDATTELAIAIRKDDPVRARALLVLRLLAANPDARVDDPTRVLYDAAMAAELDEPGALAALLDLKLSGNAQFQDRPGACKLIGTAASCGDQTTTPRLAECRAK